MVLLSKGQALFAIAAPSARAIGDGRVLLQGMGPRDLNSILLEEACVANEMALSNASEQAPRHFVQDSQKCRNSEAPAGRERESDDVNTRLFAALSRVSITQWTACKYLLSEWPAREGHRVRKKSPTHG
jgi:hypothetical protein